MITIHFHGLLKKKFGTEFVLDVKSPAEAIRALVFQLPGLEQFIKDNDWHVLRGSLDRKDDDSAESLTLEFGEVKEMHLIPAVRGARNGVFQTILGVVMIAASIILYGSDGGALMAAGVGMLIGGIVAMTTKIPTNEDSTGVDDNSSFLFERPSNTSSQGVAIPRGYGRMRTGSILVSASVASEQLKPA